MDKYYYLAAELPFLKFNENPGINRDVFLKEAEKWLNSRDFDILRRVNINDFYSQGDDTGVLKEYRNFEKTLREELVLFRKTSAINVEYKKLRILKPDLMEGSPLDIERSLLFLRWKFIEDKENGHYFDWEFLVLYFLKLQILERLFTFNKEKGIRIFDQLCEITVKEASYYE